MDVKELAENAAEIVASIKEVDEYIGTRIDQAMKPVVMLCGSESAMEKKARIANMKTILMAAKEAVRTIDSEIDDLLKMEEEVVSVKCGGG